MLKLIQENIPVELQQIPQWVCWKAKPKNNGKVDKIPFDPKTGRAASSTDEKTWGDFEQALSAYQNGSGYAGIGVVLNGGPFIGVDLDDCYNSAGEVESWARDIINRLNSYTETSPSGKGVRIFLRGTLNRPGRRKGKIECYNNGRFLTVTGHRVKGTLAFVMDRYEEIDAFHREFIARPESNQKPPELTGSVDLDDIDLISKASKSKNGALFARLYSGDWSGYPSQSEADLALCNLLAFWTGCDADQMERIFRQSGLYREKDDKHPTYLRDTIQKAINGCKEVYTGGRTSPAQDFALDWDAVIGSEPEPGQEPLQVSASIELDDMDLINRASRAKTNGELFDQLYSGDWTGYDNQEEAIQELNNLLAFWTDKNADQMERIFRQSGLYREDIENLPEIIQTAINQCKRVHKVFYRS